MAEIAQGSSRILGCHESDEEQSKAVSAQNAEMFASHSISKALIPQARPAESCASFLYNFEPKSFHFIIRTKTAAMAEDTKVALLV